MRLLGDKRSQADGDGACGSRMHLNSSQRRSAPQHRKAPTMRERVKIFLDCDGVLADFDSHALAYFGMPPREYEASMGSSRFWAELEAKGDFYRKLPVMPDAAAQTGGVPCA